MKKSSKIKIITVFAIILIVVSVFTIIWIKKDETNEIIKKTLDAFGNVKSYKYTSSGSLISNEIDGVDKYLLSGPYTMTCEVDISNKNLIGWMNVEPTTDAIDSLESEFLRYNRSFTNESLDLFDYTYYYTNSTFYDSNDNITYNTDSSDNVWYSFSQLDRILSYMLTNATLKQLDDEKIDNNECVVIKVKPNVDDAELKQAHIIDFLLPYRYAESGHEEDWAYFYDIDIKYWIEKDSYLIKKATFDVNYNLKYSFYPYNSTELLKRNYFWNYTTEILFYDYDKIQKIESPWKDYEDKAKVELTHFNYSNTRFGFGFNPPRGWEQVDYNNIISVGAFNIANVPEKYPDFYLKNESFSNLSFSIISKEHYYFYRNFSEEVEYDLEQIIENTIANQNFSLLYHGQRTVNGMNAYEIVTLYTGLYFDNYNLKTKQIYIEKDDRLFFVRITGYENLYESHLLDIEQSIDLSLTIISPYVEFY